MENFDLDTLLGNTELNGVSSSSTGYEELPTGYYLCELEEATLEKSKTSGKPMVKFAFKVVQNGIIEVVDENGDAYKARAPHTKNRKIFKYYILDSEKNVKTLVSDLLKFEGEEPGTELLGEVLRDDEGKLTRLSTDILLGCLDVVSGSSIYIKSDTTESKKNPGEKQTWNNLTDWDRVVKLGLLEVPDDSE